MTRISEHYDLSECDRATLLELRDMYRAMITHKRQRMLVNMLGFESAQDGLKQIDALLAEKYPEARHE